MSVSKIKYSLASLVLFFLITTKSSSQSVPQGFNYQTTIRNFAGVVYSNHTVTIQFSIYSGSASGTLQWQEKQHVATDEYGAVKLIIGQGTRTGGAATAFNQINWASNSYYLKASIDITGGTNYVALGTTQLFSVPYAFYSLATSNNHIYSLANYQDVNLTGQATGLLLKYNGTFWIPAIDNHHDTVLFAYNAGHTQTADTALYVYLPPSSDSVHFAYGSDTAQHSSSAQNVINTDTAYSADTAVYAFAAAPSCWIQPGNTIGNATDYIGTNDTASILFKTFNTTRAELFQNNVDLLSIGNPVGTASLALSGINGLEETGTFGSGNSSNAIASTRFVWLPEKASCRAGTVDIAALGDSLGNYSFAAGLDNTVGNYSFSSGYGGVVGDNSIAIGRKCKATARGNYPNGGCMAFGDSCVASFDRAVSIGRGNQSTGIVSISIGQNNLSSGSGSYAMGTNCSATGQGSVAIGYHASNVKQGSFVYADASSATAFSSPADNSFAVRAVGGVYFNTGFGMSVFIAPGGGSWTTVSDKRKKENFATLDYEDILNKIGSMKITSWNYKSQSKHIRHIGPMAQDFYKLFNIGENNTSICSGDMDGVIMAGIKGVNNRILNMHSLDNIDVLKNKINELNNTAELNNRLDAIEAALDKKTN